MISHTKEELEQLLDQYQGLIISQANFFKPRNSDERQELIQIATLGALSALRFYDAEKGKLSTFLTHCIRNSILRHLKKQKRTLPLIDIAIEPSENFQELLPDLTAEEQALIDYKLMNYSRQEIAKEMGIDIRMVGYKLSKLYEKIRIANED
jgi:RNA polymerase sigma factor (sigma-70 family)